MDPVIFVADAGKESGLGHVSRSSAVAVALGCKGIETRCHAYGADAPFERDGIRWTPLPDGLVPAAPHHVVVIDSYRLPREVLVESARSNRLVLMHDDGDPPAGAALVVSTAAAPALAALRPAFWGLPARDVHPVVELVLVTTGAGLPGEVGSALAEAVAGALPSVDVALVRAPHALQSPPPRGVQTLDAPTSLLEPLLDADLVVSAGGQTMLEAAAAGTPCVALALVENQRRQAVRLAELGAVRLVEPPTPASVGAAAWELANDPETRRSLSREAQRTIDGYGALRVAFRIARLAGAES